MSIDAFLQELFPTPPAQAPGASFGDRFAPAVEQPMGPMPGPGADLGMNAGGPMPLPPPRPDIEGILSGRGGGGMLPQGMTPTTGSLPPGMPTEAPLPPPRPDVEGILSGRVPGPGNMAPGGPGGPGPGALPIAAPNMDIMAKLLGPSRTALGGPGGVDAGRLSKMVRASLAGGFAGGNPNFKGGAFMKGAGGALGGGLKSEKESDDAEATAAEKAQKQANYERSQTNTEETAKALRKLYGERGAALMERAKNPGSAGKSAWNKPAAERYKDAERLIIDKTKQINGSLPLSPKKEERDAAKKEIDAFKARTYKQYGFDENGQELPNATPSQGSGGMRGGGTYQDPHVPENQEQFDKIPAGQYFINPADGEIMRKKASQQKTSAADGGAEADAA